MALTLYVLILTQHPCLPFLPLTSPQAGCGHLAVPLDAPDLLPHMGTVSILLLGTQPSPGLSDYKPAHKHCSSCTFLFVSGHHAGQQSGRGVHYKVCEAVADCLKGQRTELQRHTCCFHQTLGLTCNWHAYVII